MAEANIASLDVDRTEHGLGTGKLELITGKVFSDPVVRNAPGFTSTFTKIGEADAYDISSATALRLFYDVLLNGAGFLEFLIQAIASQPGKDMEPVPLVKDVADWDRIRFTPDLIVLPDSDGPLFVRPGVLRFDTSRRGYVTINRPYHLIDFAIRTDSPSPSSAGIALAVQSHNDEGGE